jgi:hypothetical protein
VSCTGDAGHAHSVDRPAVRTWSELALSAPWCCGPAGHSSTLRAVDRNRSPNMWTLIGIGVAGRVRLQRGGHGGTRPVPGLLPRTRPRGRVFRGRPP